MRQYRADEQTTRGPEPAPHRVGAWHHDPVGRQAALRSWGTTAATGALLPLLSAWSRPWSGVAAQRVAAGIEQGAHRLPSLLAVSIGILSWLAGVVIVAALLLGGLLLLNALVQWCWPQDVRPSLDRVPTRPSAKAPPWPAAWHGMCSTRSEHRASTTRGSIGARAVLRCPGRRRSGVDALRQGNPACTRPACRPEGVL